jgi:hypothetical protein
VQVYYLEMQEDNNEFVSSIPKAWLSGNNFEKRLEAFYDYLDEITFKKEEKTLEQRRAKILGD